ncbi:MAG: PocR ligand-binding domain-containing protein [Clostridia bacterium]|nr:PocR ligand-binding domain-containing protein [Clostridia bacterium]
MTKEEIVSVLSDLHKITGFRVSLHGADYSEIAAYPPEKCTFCREVQAKHGEFEKCVECDRAACKEAIEKRGAHIYKCRFGMTESVSPLYNFGTLTGFLMMGQVFEGTSDKERARLGLNYLDITDDNAENLISFIPTIDPSMVPSYVKIMTICAQYLTMSHAIPSNRPSIAHLAKEYISLHFNTKISIKHICREIGCSKSSLITAFKKEYGTTVAAFITEVRLTEAVHMLRQGEKRVGEVALLAGFSDQSYFSKVFSARYGVPPSEFEKIDTGSHIPDNKEN